MPVPWFQINMREAPLAISDICFTLLITPILRTDLREENNIKECIRLGNKEISNKVLEKLS